MATAVTTVSLHCFSKKWHLADIKNIAGDDQSTLMVDRNSANIAYTFGFYVCLRLRDHDCCSAADDNGSCHGLAPSFFKEMTLCRHQKPRQRWPGSIKIPHLPKFMLIKSSKTAQQTSFFASRTPPLWCHCALFFSYYHSQRLLFSPTKNNFSMTLTSPKNRDIHIEEFFVDSIYSKTIDIIIKIIYFFYFWTEVLFVKPGMWIMAPWCR